MAQVKTANVNVRISEDIKEEATAILNDLGLSQATAIDLFYRQIIIQKGIPFDVTLKTRDQMTDEEFDAKMAKAYEQSLKGETIPIEEAFDEIRRG